MLNTLRVEWMKVKNYRAFWILLAVTVLSIPGVNFMFYDLFDNSFPKMKGNKMAMNIFGTPFGFPDVWQTTSWNASLVFLVPAILIITLTTNEFTYKTHRQNVIDGWSRSQFFRVKLVEILLLSLFTTLLVVLTALCFGTFGNKVPEGQSIWQGSRFAAFYFVQMISYSMIAFMLALFIKRAGLAMGIFFIYMIVESIIVGYFGNHRKIEAVNYLPEEVTDRLIPQPYLKAIFTQQRVSYWESHIPIYLAVAAVYLLLYYFGASRRFLRTDL